MSVYSPQTAYAIAMLDVRGQTYIGLVDLLEPLGSVEAKPDGKKYKLKFTAPGARQQELEFHDGKDGGKIRGDKIKLPANFVLQNERGYVPLAGANEVLVRLGFQPVELRPAAQRLFIGNVVERFSLDLKKGTPSRLVISFPAPVNPTIATEPGQGSPDLQARAGERSGGTRHLRRPDDQGRDVLGTRRHCRVGHRRPALR